MKSIVRIFSALLMIAPLCIHAQEVDASIMQKIREEGLKKSKVMEIAFNLTDKNGARLTNSEGYALLLNMPKLL